MHRLASCIREVGRKGRFVNKVKQKRGTGRQAKAAPVRAVTRLMAETLPLAGYTNILADCPGKRRPHLIRGMRADHRPNLVCQGGYRYVLMDVVFPGEMNFPDIASRWQLFASAAEQAGGEFHVVVPRWVEGVGAGRDAVSKAAEAIGIRISHIWEI